MVFWEPWTELEWMRRRIDRLMRRMWSGIWEPVEEEMEAFESFPVDISETENELIVRADLPGFSKEEITARATENTLEIAAQHKEKKIEKTEKMFRAERRFGAARRAFTLPVAVNPETAKAEFKNGVLTITLEKKEKKKVGKEIKIE
jgi:HSP20 family protein